MKTNDPLKTFRAGLARTTHLDPRKNPIHSTIEGDSLAIQGFVPAIADKKRIVLLAMGIEGVAGVIDRLRVTPSRHMGDKEIEKHVMDAYSLESSLTGMDLRAEVRDAVVDIEGTVPSLAHKRFAGVLAWWVPGTSDVINSLDVVPPEEDGDDEIADALRMVLEKDRLVDPSSISISVKGWAVTLSGLAANEGQRKAAENDAWYIWGVNEVVNGLKVG